MTNRVRLAARCPSRASIREIEAWSLAKRALLVIGVLSAGCTSAGKHDGALLVFPPPPSRPRVQFLTFANGAEQAEGPISAVVQLAFGDDPINRPAMDKPYGVAARDGVVYVCDTKIPGVCRLNFVEHTFDVMGIEGPGRLRKPIHLIIDPLGYKFVADAQRKQIVVFGPDDKYVMAFDVPLPAHPVDVALWGDELYVLDNDDSCQIVVLDRQTGAVLRSFGGPGLERGQFRVPNSLCIGPDGYLYVSDTLNWRIQKLTREGVPLWDRGDAGHLLGQFGRPRGIRAGPDGVIYVADAATEIVQMFDSDGQMLMHFGGPGRVPGTLVLPAAVAIDATSIPYFKQHMHEKFDAEYLMFVSSQYGQHRISVYAFGSFPEGYELSEAGIASLPSLDPQADADTPVPTLDDQDEPPSRRD